MEHYSVKHLERFSLVEQTVAAIKKAIVDGTFRPGDRFIEAKLAASLKIAVPTVREALIELEHQGFVTRIPHRGTFVTQMTEERFTQICSVREYLEVLAMRLARGRAKGADLDEVEKQLKAMQNATEAADRLAYYEADLAFHRAFWKLSGNDYLAETLDRMVAPLLVFGVVILKDWTNREVLLRSTQEHEQMVHYLTHGSDQEAEEVVRRAISFFREDELRRYSQERARQEGSEEDAAFSSEVASR